MLLCTVYTNHNDSVHFKQKRVICQLRTGLTRGELPLSCFNVRPNILENWVCQLPLCVVYSNALKLRAKTGGNLASYLIYQRYDNDLDSRNVYYVEKVSFVLQFTSVQDLRHKAMHFLCRQLSFCLKAIRVIDKLSGEWEGKVVISWDYKDGHLTLK